jgi:LmbE family N-acetylglucosaminyl deacetylase
MAAQAAAEKVTRLAEDEASELVPVLPRMHTEAAETEDRCTTIIDTMEAKKTAIQEEASTTKRKGTEMMKTYLDDSADALDGLESF